MPATPRISVLLPLTDERGAGVDCVRAWTSQSAEPQSYEIVALAPAEDEKLERSVRPLLRENDQWLVAPGRGEYELFNLGAECGTGEFIFVTEAHCIPERDCLAAMLEELERNGAPGVRGASIPEAHGELGELERDAFEDALRIEEEPWHWRKVLIHSLALRRELYLEAGGLPPGYGDFAPWPLAITLHSSGQQLVFSPRPRVRHVYDGDLEQLGSHVRSFGRGEMLFRAHAPAGLAERYLDPAPEWEQRLGYTRAGAWRAVTAAAAFRDRAVRREAVVHAGVALFGPRLPALVERIRAARAARAARRQTGPGEQRRRTFAEFWWRTSRRGRIEGLAEARPGEARVEQARSLDLRESVAGRAIGVFHLEHSPDGVPIRWTAPLALLKVSVPGAGMARARIGLLEFDRPEGSRPPRPRIAIDGGVVAAEVSDQAIEFEIPSGEHWIGIASQPFHPRRHGADDSRVLGVPIRSLEFRDG